MGCKNDILYALLFLSVVALVVFAIIYGYYLFQIMTISMHLTAEFGQPPLSDLF